MLRMWICAAVAVSSASVAAQRVYVDGSVASGGNGLSWAAAFNSVQAALAGATSGTEIWVAQGVYGGAVVVPNGVTVRGGFRAGATATTQARPFVYPTVLDGGGTQRVMALGDRCVVEGLVIRNGNAQAPGGGGVLIDGVSPTLRHCVLTGNRNTGGRGAALLVINAANPLVSGCLFYGNANTGHTIDVDLGASGTYDFLTVADNPHNGLHMQNGAGCVITNCMFVRNGGRGICDFSVGPVNRPTLWNNLFWQNSVSLMHYRGQEFQTIGQVNALSYALANVAADPLFVDAASGNYRLGAGSGALDLGTGNPGPVTDVYGNPRALDGNLDGAMQPDIGFYEWSNANLTVTGATQPGSTLALALTGTAGLAGFVAAGAPGGAVVVPPLGTVFGLPLVLVPVGALPANLTLTIPLTAYGDVVLQGVGLGAGVGNLSNVVELRIQ